MKKLIFLAAFCVVLCLPAFAQVSNAKVRAAMAKFPGIERSDMETLITAKTAVGIALPTWLPKGFTLEKIRSRIGRRVSLDDREFIIIYSRQLPNGKKQRFALEAGFDGLGGLPYDVTKTISSPVGQIDLMYEPPDPDSAQRLRNFSMTEWFTVGRNAVHYDGMYGSADGDAAQTMLTLAETEKILRSLNRL